MQLPNLELITKSWFWLEQHKNDEAALGQFADLLIANKPSLAKYKRKIILFLQKIDYVDLLFNGEIGQGKLEVDGVACCWLWTACKNKAGYGYFCIEQNPIRIVKSNRIMLFLIDPDFDIDSEEQACYRCDNPACCNPNHIWPGTHQDNNSDKVNKGRQLTGINVGNAKLTDDQIWAIFDDIDTQQAIADKYGVCIATISKIKNGEHKLADKTKSLPKNQNTRSLQGKNIKVTEEIFTEILEFHKAGWYQREIAEELGLSKITIGNVLNGKNLKRFD